MKLRIVEDADVLGNLRLNTGGNEESNEVIDQEPDMDTINSINAQLNDTEHSGEQTIDIYEDLEALGFVFMLASNDVHTIHLNACGDNFKELHKCADDLYKLLDDYSDRCLEMACEDGHFVNNLNNARDLLTTWDVYEASGRAFNIKTGTKAIIEILNNVIVAITELYNDVPSDMQSVFDEWTRELTSRMNYFLKRVVDYPVQFGSKNESMMLRNTRHDKDIYNRRRFHEQLDKLKLGQSYPMFYQVEDHIDDYNCSLLGLNKGDYIIRDFQFGHLPNGGNKGYIPYEITDIIYDRDDDISGYRDKRKRIELYDGNEYFYIVCEMDRFNGMFHKLKKSSIQFD